MKSIHYLFVVSWLFTTSPALADERLDGSSGKGAIEERHQLATELFRQGVDAYKEDRIVDALDHFTRASELRPNWRLLFNIGQCHASLRQYGQALDAFETYLVEGGDEVDPERQFLVQQEIDRLHRLTGELVISAPPDTLIRIGDRVMGRAPLPGPVRVAAGLQRVVAEKEGILLFDKTIRVYGRGQREIAISARPSLAAPAPRRAASDKEPTLRASSVHLRNSGVALASGGVALLAASVITGTIALRTEERLEKNCPGRVCAEASDLVLRDRAAALKVTTDVLWPIGAVAAGAGAVLLWRWFLRREKAAAVTIAPALSEQHGGIQVTGVF